MATARKKNKLLRVIIPAGAVIIGLIVVIATLNNAGNQLNKSKPATEQSETTADSSTAENTTPADSGEESAADSQSSPDEKRAENTAAPSGEEAENDEAAATSGDEAEENDAADEKTAVALTDAGTEYHVKPLGDVTADFQPLGNLDPDGPYLLQVRFSKYGAGLHDVTLSRFYNTVKHQENYLLLQEQTIKTSSGAPVGMTPLAATWIRVNGKMVSLFSRPDPENPGKARGDIWRETGPGQFEAIIVDENGNDVLRIERRYRLKENSYDIALEQRLTNLTDKPLLAKLYQQGPVDPTHDTGVYGGDRRRIRFGFLLPPNRDPGRRYVLANEFLLDRRKLLTQSQRNKRLWPNEKSLKDGYTLSWLAMTNRYFAFVIHAPVSDKPDSPRDFPIVESVYPIVVGDSKTTNAAALEIQCRELQIEPGRVAREDMGVFAGPLDRKLLKDPQLPYKGLGLDTLIVYRFGCTWCTFQWLARFLLAFLGFLHTYILHDWALAIMALVAVVRGILHPLTKRSQISMAKFGKQAQALKPKQEKIKQKYADDPKKQQEELRKLMQEEGINPANMLGCLPMMLQTPIWIALYAMLFYAIDLRQQPAFFGLFQKFGNWSFLADLSQPDHFIQFASSVRLPLMGDVSALNILPLLMGVIFFLQQKYMTPTTPTTSSEQETQQKIMKVMMVVMFPLFLYNAPSGLTLYILTSSATGVLESRHIRKHIKELDEKNAAVGKKKTGTTGKKKKKSLIERLEEEQRKKRQQQLRSGKKRK